jgi:hypothetical protein
VSRIQNPIEIENIVRTIMTAQGISSQNYVEYANLNLYRQGGFPNLNTIWLIRQWRYGEIITYNDPLNFYDPALITPFPLYQAFIYQNYDPQTNKVSDEQSNGYAYFKTIGQIKNNVLIRLYKRIK